MKSIADRLCTVVKLFILSLPARFKHAAQVLHGKKNILKSHTVVSLVTVCSTLLVIFVMTGVLYFRNEVFIHDSGETSRMFTMLGDPDEILAEAGAELVGLDYYEFTGFVEDIAHIEIKRAYEISVHDEDNVITAQVRAGDNVGDVLARAMITVGEHDIVEPGLSEPCTGDVTITRAFFVELTADGAVEAYPVTGGTVAELLKNAEVTLNSDDLITPALDAIVDESTEIVIERVKYVDRITVNSIPYATTEQPSTLYAIGHSEVVTEGINGSEQVTTREKYIDGVLVDSIVTDTAITNEPVDEVILTGTALATPYSKREFSEILLVDGIPVEYDYVVSGKSCAYTAREGSGTASGRKLEIGTVAVDPNLIPYGSLVYIVTQDGRTVYGAAVAADTGYLTDVVVDLYMGVTSEHYDDACDWGARWVDIYVVSVGAY